jgi:hypothetical protein
VRPLLFEVGISDPGLEMWAVAWEVTKTAAYSDSQFVQIELGVEGVTFEEADQSMREHGYGPHLNVLHLKMWPQIILPRAPEWAWKKPGED